MILYRAQVLHAQSNDITEGCAADWTIGQLRAPVQRIADRIEAPDPGMSHVCPGMWGACCGDVAGVGRFVLAAPYIAASG